MLDKSKYIFLTLMISLAMLLGGFLIGQNSTTTKEAPEAVNVPLISTHKLVDKNPISLIDATQEQKTATLYDKEVIIPKGCVALDYTDSSVPNIAICHNEDMCVMVAHHNTGVIDSPAGFESAVHSVSMDLLNANILSIDSVVFDKNGGVVHVFDADDNKIIVVSKKGTSETYSMLITRKSLPLIRTCVTEFIKSFGIENTTIEGILEEH